MSKKSKVKPVADRTWGGWIEGPDGSRIKDFPIHEGQRKALASETRITCVLAGSGGGKTSMIPLWLMKQVQKSPQGRFLVVAPTFAMLRRSTLKEIDEAFSGLDDFDVPTNVQRMEKTLPCGATIIFASADTPDSIQGIHANAAVLDECGLMKADMYRIARQRTYKHSGQLLLTTTPYTHNWVFHDVYKPWKEGAKDITLVNFKATDNPTVPKEEFERERKRLPAWRFAMLFLGEFSRPDGVVFPDMRDCVIEPNELPRVKPETFIGGLDFGYNDPAAALVGFVHENKLFVVYEKYMSGLTTREFAKDFPPGVLWFCDSSRPDSIRELKRMGVHARPCRKGPGSVVAGIDYINGLINSGRLKIVKGAVSALLAEADLYSYEQGERENEYTDRPVDEHNHACDALRYLAQGCKRRRLLRDEIPVADLAA